MQSRTQSMSALGNALYDVAIPRPRYTIDGIIKAIEEAKGEQFPSWLFTRGCYFVDEAMVTYSKEFSAAYPNIDGRIMGIGMGIGHLVTKPVFEDETGRLKHSIELDHYETMLSPGRGKFRYWEELSKSMVNGINKVCGRLYGSVRLYACSQSYTYLGRFSPNEAVRAEVRWKRDPPRTSKKLLDEKILLIKTNGVKDSKIEWKDKTYEGALKDWVGTLVRQRLFIHPKSVDVVLPKQVQRDILASGRALDIKTLRKAARAAQPDSVSDAEPRTRKRRLARATNNHT